MNMSKSKYVVFGETSCNTIDSNYTYANAMTFDIMEILGDDERFLDCTQADIVNLSLIVLYGFISPDKRDAVTKSKLRDFIDDFEDFKNFAMFTMNHCRLNNELYNYEITQKIEKETAQ